LSDVTVIVPTYKEVDNLSELVRRIHASCNGVNILVVDDSPDLETSDLAKQLGCQVIHRTNRKGLSSAIIEGIEYSSTNKVIVMDADLQHPPETLPSMIQALDNNELVIASRWIKGGGVKEWSKKRILISKVANLLSFPLVHKIKDRTSGFFGLRKNSVNTKILNPIGWKASLEVMVKGNYKSFKEVPFVFETRKHGESKLSNKIIVEYLKQLKDLYKTWLKKSQLVKFVLVGALGTIIGLVVLWLFTDVIGMHYLLSRIISFIAGVTSNYIFNSMWTFKQNKGSTGWLKYAIISLFGLGLNELIMWLMTGLGGVHYILSALVGIVLVFIFNYFLSRRIVWASANGSPVNS
jgi:dolichol-phosphate mannosyltransferase